MLPDPEEYAREQSRYPAPEGTRFVWRDEISSETFGLEWSVDPAKLEGKGCRFGAARGRSACGAPAVAAINRGKADRPRWWVYCSEHLFGRVFDDGKVFSLILEEVAP
jgi:hypothetical protein